MSGLTLDQLPSEKVLRRSSRLGRGISEGAETHDEVAHREQKIQRVVLESGSEEVSHGDYDGSPKKVDYDGENSPFRPSRSMYYKTPTSLSPKAA